MFCNAVLGRLTGRVLACDPPEESSVPSQKKVASKKRPKGKTTLDNTGAKNNRVKLGARKFSRAKRLLGSNNGDSRMKTSKSDTQMPHEEGAWLLVVVAVALLNDRGQVLLSRRTERQTFAGMWEFPGGKVEKNERPEAALVRELQEELGITVDEADLRPLSFGTHAFGDHAHLLMPLYECSRWSGEVSGKEGQEVEWCSISEIRQRDLPPGDLPLIDAVERAALAYAQPALSIAT
ncbi:g10277 [Coccomyxa elongata]